MIYTAKYLQELRDLEKKNNEQQYVRPPGSYYSTKKETGETRDNGRARMIEQYGFA